MFRVDVVMDRLELIDGMEFALPEDGLGDDAAVQSRVPLHDMHVVDVIVEQGALAPRHFIRHLHLGNGDPGLPNGKQPGELLFPSLIPHALDKSLPLGGDLGFPFFPQGIQVLISGPLVVFRHVLAGAAGAGVNDQPDAVLLIPIQLPEVIAAAQGAQAESEYFRGDPAAGPAETGHGIGGHRACQAVRLRPRFHPGGDLRLGNAVELRQIDPFFFQLRRQHPAADIDADQIGDHLVPYGHRRPDHTPCPGVAVRHDPDPGSLDTGLIEQVGHLRGRRLIAAVREYLRGVEPALDHDQTHHPQSLKALVTSL